MPFVPHLPSSNPLEWLHNKHFEHTSAIVPCYPGPDIVCLSFARVFASPVLGYFAVDVLSNRLFLSSRSYHYDLEHASSSPSRGTNLVLVMATMKDGGLVY